VVTMMRWDESGRIDSVGAMENAERFRRMSTEAEWARLLHMAEYLTECAAEWERRAGRLMDEEIQGYAAEWTEAETA
jgi:hypothetical protein